MSNNYIKIENEISNDGIFKRQENQFITTFGNEEWELPVTANKYRLIWSPACPWAHRAVIVRKILGLEEVISLGTVDPIRPKIDHVDWSFTLDDGMVDPVLGIKYLSESYLKTDKGYSKRPTVPAIVDIDSSKVVQNDYHNLTYYLERDWKKFHANDVPDLFPFELENEIRELNDIIFHEINNGVYKAGFAKSQLAYENAYDVVFNRLDWLEQRLSTQRYLHGENLTDSDVRLYTTLVRFDIAYYGGFNVNKRRIIDYPNLWSYVKDLYQTEGFGDTTDFSAIKKHYYLSLHIDPNEKIFKILPKGPDVSPWLEPSNRKEEFSRSAN